LRADRSVYNTVSRVNADPHLREAFSFHTLLVGGNPFETSSIYTLIHYLERTWGVFYPRGGTGALVRALCTLFEELGGELRLSSPVERIEPARDGRAGHFVHSRARHERFDLVVSNADLHHTYATLLHGSPAAARTAKRLRALDWSMSLFVLYFGTDRTYRDQVAHHTVLFGPRYRELLDDIFDKKILAPDFSLYLHAPTRTDPSLAPPGCENFYVLSPVPHLESGTDWSREAPAYRDKLFQFLEETAIPGLRDNLVTERMITPQHFQDELNSLHGAAFSIQPVLTQSAYFRFHNRSEDVPNLYLVGAGTHPGAGMPGVLSSAKVVDRLIPDVDGTGNSRDPIAGTHAA
jgi:phytoene desaturase